MYMKKKFAVFCPLKDEFTFSLIWHKYYSKFLPKEDIYILDFKSTAPISLNCNIVQTDKNILDAWELFAEIKKFHQTLLEQYEYVIPTDVDEILFHPNGLDSFIKDLKTDTAKAVGYEIIHLPDKEPPCDQTKNILAQRNYWFRSSQHYDKTLITNKPLNWHIGLHGVHGVDQNTPHEDSDLLLVHLHRFDYTACVNRHLAYAEKQWSEKTIKNNNNWHYRTKDTAEINNWYFTNSVKHITKIPTDLKTLIDI